MRRCARSGLPVRPRRSRRFRNRRPSERRCLAPSCDSRRCLYGQFWLYLQGRSRVRAPARLCFSGHGFSAGARGLAAGLFIGIDQQHRLRAAPGCRVRAARAWRRRRRPDRPSYRARRGPTGGRARGERHGFQRVQRPDGIGVAQRENLAFVFSGQWNLQTSAPSRVRRTVAISETRLGEQIHETAGSRPGDRWEIRTRRIPESGGLFRAVSARPGERDLHFRFSSKNRLPHPSNCLYSGPATRCVFCG